MAVSAATKLAEFLETIKFAHSLFALPFALLGAVLAARGVPNLGQLALIIVCMVLIRTVAMGYNRLADHALDAVNPRTASRALPAGRLSRRFVWTVLLFATAGAGAACYLFLRWYANPWPLILLAPLLVWAGVYSHAKRFTWLSHYWLGSVLGSAVIASVIAVEPARLGVGPALLALAVCLWTAGFDIIYAMLDLDHDRRLRLCSIPARFGPAAALAVARATHAAAFVLFVLGGYLAGLRELYALGLVATAVLLVAEHRIVRPDDLSRVNLAFFTLNGVLSIFLSAMGILDVFHGRR